jgi:tetratricopeptide (TPR) repeat protein
VNRRAWLLRGAGRLAMALALWLPIACAQGVGPSRALHIEEVAHDGDQTRRASTRLVVDGLTAEAQGDADRALSQYERAIQIDAGNPYVYLALARHYIEQRDVELAFGYLDRARLLLESSDHTSPRVEVHLIGLRGNALQLAGRTEEGGALLAQAARRAPKIWGDGHLSADELR